MSAPEDLFCPRHGRASRPAETPGLRCDCASTVMDAVAPLREGKWVSAALAHLVGPNAYAGDTISEVEARANQAVREAVMAGYAFGLRGGVK